MDQLLLRDQIKYTIFVIKKCLDLSDNIQKYCVANYENTSTATGIPDNIV